MTVLNSNKVTIYKDEGVRIGENATKPYLVFTYDPTEWSDSEGAVWKEKSTKGGFTSFMEYTGPGVRELSCTVLFNDYLPDKRFKQDYTVAEVLIDLKKLVRPVASKNNPDVAKGGTNAKGKLFLSKPPILLLGRGGRPQFRCILKPFTVKEVMHRNVRNSPSSKHVGEPIRAYVNLTFVGYNETQEAAAVSEAKEVVKKVTDFEEGFNRARTGRPAFGGDTRRR